MASVRLSWQCNRTSRSAAGASDAGWAHPQHTRVRVRLRLCASRGPASVTHFELTQVANLGRHWLTALVERRLPTGLAQRLRASRTEAVVACLAHDFRFADAT